MKPEKAYSLMEKSSGIMLACKCVHLLPCGKAIMVVTDNHIFPRCRFLVPDSSRCICRILNDIELPARTFFKRISFNLCYLREWQLAHPYHHEHYEDLVIRKNKVPLGLFTWSEPHIAWCFSMIWDFKLQGRVFKIGPRASSVRLLSYALWHTSCEKLIGGGSPE